MFFIITKLVNTDDIASPTLPPTTGIKVPEINRIPFMATLSELVAKMLLVVSIPVKTVDKNDRRIINNLRTVFIILLLYSSVENDDNTVNDNIDPIMGRKNLSAKLLINIEIYIEKELYVSANEGFLDAIIIDVIIGKYVFINMVDVFIPVTVSINTLLIGSIMNDKITKVVVREIIFFILLFSFKKDEAIADIIKTRLILKIFLPMLTPFLKASSVMNFNTLDGVISNNSCKLISVIPKSFKYWRVWSSVLSHTNSYSLAKQIIFKVQVIKKAIVTVYNVFFILFDKF